MAEPQTMKALSLWQPHAWLVAVDLKRIETRSWATAYRGPLAIHAAASLAGLRPLVFDYEDGWAVGELPDDPIKQVFCWQRIDGQMHVQRYVDGYGPFPMPLGAVVATCMLVDVVPIVEQVRSMGDEDPGPLLLTNGLSGHMWLNAGGTADVEDQRPYGNFTPGRFAWLLDDIKPVDPPIPARGHQGLWTWAARPEGATNG